MSLKKKTKVFQLHCSNVGAVRKPSRGFLEAAFSLFRRLQLPRRRSDELTTQALQTRATNLFSPTFKKWNRFN
jgi:hypothetical protein